jgi:hypothetical protein
MTGKMLAILTASHPEELGSAPAEACSSPRAPITRDSSQRRFVVRCEQVAPLLY